MGAGRLLLKVGWWKRSREVVDGEVGSVSVLVCWDGLAGS